MTLHYSIVVPGDDKSFPNRNEIKEEENEIQKQNNRLL